MKKIWIVLCVLLICFGSVHAESDEITILYTNDIHAAEHAYASVVSYRESLHGNVITVDGGDQMIGADWVKVNHGKILAHILKLVKYDVMVPGNHDFDGGIDQILQAEKEFSLPYISCNAKKDEKLLFEPYRIIEKGIYKIGFVGLITPETLTISKHARTVFSDAGYDFSYTDLQKWIDACKAQCDMVFLVGHTGLKESTDILANVSGVDGYFAAHDHEASYDAYAKDKNGNAVPLIETGSHFSSLASVTVQPSRHQVVSIEQINPEPSSFWGISFWIFYSKAVVFVQKRWMIVILVLCVILFAKMKNKRNCSVL